MPTFTKKKATPDFIKEDSLNFPCAHAPRLINEQRRLISISFWKVDGLIQNALADIKH